MNRGDGLRLGINLVLGPPLAFLFATAVLSLQLLLPVQGAAGDNAPIVAFILFVALPAIPLSYLAGVVPALFVTLATSLLTRVMSRQSWLLLAALPIGALPYWMIASWLIGPQRVFDSADFNAMLVTAAPVGGALSATLCTGLAGWLARRWSK